MISLPLSDKDNTKLLPKQQEQEMLPQPHRTMLLHCQMTLVLPSLPLLFQSEVHVFPIFWWLQNDNE